MAGDWIKMRVDLMDDPAVFQIRQAIGDDRLQIVGRLHLFWAWADKHAVDGVVDGATSLLVDDIAGKEGFAAALIKAKWLHVLPNGIELPNADRHNGESAKERSLKNARQARWRQNKASQASTAPSTQASTREEKRREDIDTGAKAPKRKSQVPEDFTPNETGVKAAEAAGLNLPRELENFRNHHKAKGTTMLDWQAAWRTWVGMAVQFGRGGKANDDPYGLKGAL